MKYLIKN